MFSFLVEISFWYVDCCSLYVKRFKYSVHFMANIEQKIVRCVEKNLTLQRKLSLRLLNDEGKNCLPTCYWLIVSQVFMGRLLTNGWQRKTQIITTADCAEIWKKLYIHNTLKHNVSLKYTKGLIKFIYV